MSLTLIESSPGLQIKRDVNFSNLTLNCDPRLIVPDTKDNKNSGIFKPSIAGKIAAESDICNLDVADLTVHGKLITLGTHDIELCNIVCADTFSVDAGTGIALTTESGDITSVSAGDTSLSSGTGKMDIKTTSGEMTLSTTLAAGAMTLSTLFSAPMTLSTTNGAMNLKTTDNGAMTLSVLEQAPMALKTIEGSLKLSTVKGLLELRTTDTGELNLVSEKADMNLTTGATGGMNIGPLGSGALNIGTDTGIMNLTTNGADMNLTTGAAGVLTIKSGKMTIGAATDNIGFFGKVPGVGQRPVAAGATTEDIIAALKELGLFRDP